MESEILWVNGRDVSTTHGHGLRAQSLGLKEALYTWGMAVNHRMVQIIVDEKLDKQLLSQPVVIYSLLVGATMDTYQVTSAVAAGAALGARPGRVRSLST